MFVIKKVHSFTWPVRVQVPEDGGRKVQRTFTAVFTVVPPERVSELVHLAMGDESGATNSDLLILREVVQDWKDVGDEQGNPILFSAENLEALAAHPYIRRALVEAYLDAVSGNKVRLGN